METQQLISNYHTAWTSGDMKTARSFLADDLIFRGSVQTFQRADDFINTLAMFQQMIRKVTMIHALYAANEAALLYDCDTIPPPVGVIRTAEFFTVAEGKITAIKLVFDPTELRKFMG